MSYPEIDFGPSVRLNWITIKARVGIERRSYVSVNIVNNFVLDLA